MVNNLDNHHEDMPYKILGFNDDVIINSFEIIFDSASTLLENVMTHDVITLDHTKTAHDAAMAMMEKRIGSVVVTAYGKPFGIVTERDLARLLTFLNVSDKCLILSYLASRPLICARSTQTIQEASDIMGKYNIDHLPILKNDTIVGMVTTKDLAKYLLCT